MNPKAPKIRHLNASHPLLIELEDNVQELERQLQFRELMKKQQRPTEKVEPLNPVKHKTVITKEDELAFRKRLEEAKKESRAVVAEE